MKATLAQRPAARKNMVAAMVLGTALSAFGGTQEASAQTIQDVSRYCTVCWRNARLHPDSWADCTQEVLVRLLERLSPAQWNRLFCHDSLERQEFVRAIDTVKKRSQRQRHWSSHCIDIAADDNVANTARKSEDLEVLQLAATHLSSRQEQIIMKSLEGATVHEIAAEMRLPAERVSDEKYKAIQKLRKQLTSGDRQSV